MVFFNKETKFVKAAQGAPSVEALVVPYNLRVSSSL